jgi:hypothetical protein
MIMTITPVMAITEGRSAVGLSPTADFAYGKI